MSQPPPNVTPPAGGPPPAAGGASHPASPPHGYAIPPQYAPGPSTPPPGWAPPPPGWAGPAAPPGWAAPGWAAPGPPPPAVAPNGQPLASFTDRLLAWLVDTALASGVTLVLFLPVMMVVWWNMFTEMTRTNPDGTFAEPDPGAMFRDFMLPLLLAQLVLLVVMIGLYWLYHVEYLVRHDGQTLGKKAMKLRVVPLDPARKLDRRVAGRRWVVQFLASSLVPGLSYLDGFWQLWDKPWQQCLHDRFAETVVVKVSR